MPGAARMRTSMSHGVGLGIATDAAGRCVVTRVLPGGAAAFSGQVHKGDIVLSIDHRPTAGMSEGQIPEHFLGEAGTVVELGLGRPGTAVGHGQRHVRLVRQPISILDNAAPQLAPEGNGETGEMAGIGAVLATDVNGNLVVSHLVYGGAAAFTKPNDLFGEVCTSIACMLACTRSTVTLVCALWPLRFLGRKWMGMALMRRVYS